VTGSGVTAVIPNWNGSAMLAALLATVRAQTLSFDRVIVVDNGSDDDSREVARRAGAEVLALERNCGFAVAVNRGVTEVTSEWVAILNNDLELDPAWLAGIREAVADQWFGVGKILQQHNRQTIDGTFDLISRAACPWRSGAGRPDGPAWRHARPVHLPPLTAACLRRELFNRVGLLDEQFQSYLEDVDFGLRCASEGYSGVYVPGSVAYHKGSGTLGRWHPRTVRQIARNQVLLVAKHYPADLIREFGWAIAVGQLLWGALAFRHLRGWSWIAGKIEGLRLSRVVRTKGQPRVADVIRGSEAELLSLQRETGPDWYWRIYAALT
jgi:GT2 family glycosyltransferase